MYTKHMVNIMNRNYKQYQEDVVDDIKACLESLECQPILFIGSGLTRRYANGPKWDELLKRLMDECPDIKKPFAYYVQKNDSLIDIGTIISEAYRDWAWGEGRNSFPDFLFDEKHDGDIYLKFKIADFFKQLKVTETEKYSDEIKALQSIHPHSIVTTNYDDIVNEIFPEYENIIGQRILKLNNGSIGEIFKIHGSCDEPESIVINRKDYDDFIKKKKYLSAKLLTFFAEHPLIFIGYSAEDSNIKGILSDIDEILSENGELIPNIYLLQRNEHLHDNSYPQRETVIQTESNKTVRIKNIITSDFTWVFKAFAAHPAMANVNPKILRALLARNYELVRTDIPKNPIQVDYHILTSVATNSKELAKLYGITDASSPLAFNINYPYTLTSLGKALGFNGWHGANDLLQTVRETTGKDLKSSDNKYHYAIMNGKEIQSHRYSCAALDLLNKVKSGLNFDLNDLN